MTAKVPGGGQTLGWNSQVRASEIGVKIHNSFTIDLVLYPFWQSHSRLGNNQTFFMLFTKFSFNGYYFFFDTSKYVLECQVILRVLHIL